MTLKIYYYALAESTNPVRLIKEGGVPPSGYLGVWNGSLSAYVFTIDTTDGYYDPASLWDIYDGNSLILDNIELGGAQTAVNLAAHIGASTDVHGIGVGSSVVGTATPQTLSNKVISGSSNSITNLPGSALVPGTTLPAVQIRPDSGSDTYLKLLYADGARLDIEVESSAGTSRECRIYASAIKLANSAGSPIILSGVANPVSGNDAVNKATYDTLAARVSALETGAPWIGTPSVSLSVGAGIGIGLYSIRASYAVDPTNAPNVHHWEIFWSGTPINISSGALSSANLDWLRANCERVVQIGGGRGVITINTDEPVYVIAVAFDSTGSAYASAPVRGEPRAFRMMREMGDTGVAGLLQAPDTQFTAVKTALAAAGSEASAFAIWQEISQIEVIKARFVYHHQTSIKSILIGYYGRCATAGNQGYVRFSIRHITGTEVAGHTEPLPYAASFPDTPRYTTIDVSGLSAGVYQLVVGIWSGAAATTTELSEAISIKPLREVIVV